MHRGVAISSAALVLGLSQLPATAAPPALSATLAALAVGTAAGNASTYTTILNLTANARARFAIGTALLVLTATIFLWLHNSNPGSNSRIKIDRREVQVRKSE